jgi:hypothetical protein
MDLVLSLTSLLQLTASLSYKGKKLEPYLLQRLTTNTLEYQ